LEAHNLKRGVTMRCIGGGEATGIAVERIGAGASGLRCPEFREILHLRHTAAVQDQANLTG